MPKKNAFSCFVDEQHKLLGISRQEAFGSLGRTWEKLPLHERHKYEDMAGKTRTQPNAGSNTTNSGVTYAEFDRIQEEKETFKKNMTDWISSNGNEATSMISPKEFYVVMIQRHTTTHVGNVVPAEIAIVQFDIVKGVKNACSYIIKNKERWVKENAPGYQFKMYDKAKHTHAIPTKEDFPMAEEPAKIVKELIKLMNVSANSNEISLPPVFTLNVKTETIDHITEDNMEDTDKALKYLFETANSDIKPPLVYDFLQLFYTMYKVVMDQGKVKAVKPNMVREYLKSKLENDPFLLKQYGGDGCAFHHELCNSMDFSMENCALATAKRLVYLMCDYLTKGVLDDETYCPIYGKHVPPQGGKVGVRMRSSVNTPISMENALKMAVRKEFFNPISGVEITAGCGTMNGTTLLPTDRDPAIEVEQQLKKHMADLKIDDQSREVESTKFFSFKENNDRSQQDDFPRLTRRGEDEFPRQSRKGANLTRAISDIRSNYGINGSFDESTPSLNHDDFPSLPKSDVSLTTAALTLPCVSDKSGIIKSSTNSSRSSKSRLWAKFDTPNKNNTTYDSYE